MPKSKRNRKNRKPGSNGSINVAPSARDADRIAATQMVASGNVLLDAGDYTDAIAKYESAIAVDRAIALSRRNRRQIASAYASRGNARTHAGDYDGARADYEFAGELARDLPQTPAVPEAVRLFYQGQAKVGRGDYNGAIADYGHAIALNPNLDAAYHNRGAAKMEQDDYDGAIADFDQAINSNPNDADSYYNRGSAKAKQGNYDAAITDFDRAISINPGDVNAYNNRGLAKVNKDDYDAAIADFDRAISINPNDAGSYFNLGNAKAEQGDYDGAIADFDRTIAINPNDVNAYNYRGFIKSVVGNYDAAIADYGSAIDIIPHDAEAYANRGLIKAVHRDYDAAIADYDHAIILNPDFAKAYFGRGNAKALCLDYDGAIADYENASILDEDFAQDLPLLYAAKAEIDRVKEWQRSHSEVERLQSENAEFVAMADAAITEQERLQAQVDELQAKLREQQLAISYMPPRNGTRMASDADAKPDTVKVVYYQNGPEYWPFLSEWLYKRIKESQYKIRAAIARMRKGNFGDSKSVHAAGLFECRLHSGERIYYAKPSADSVVILHGGDKADSAQDNDIAIAWERWDDHQQRTAAA